MQRTADYDFSYSNEELLDLCKQQDQEALRVLLRRHEKPVYNLLSRMLGNAEDAEEALAEVFVKVWRAAGSFKGDAKFTTWLFRIASNTAHDILRSRKTRREIALEEIIVDEAELFRKSGHSGDNPETAAIESDQKARILRAISMLSEEDRLIITLYHLQECDYGEISRIANIPPANLKVKLFRARQRLRKLCEGDETEGSEDELRTDRTESAGLREGATEWS